MTGFTTLQVCFLISRKAQLKVCETLLTFKMALGGFFILLQIDKIIFPLKVCSFMMP